MAAPVLHHAEELLVIPPDFIGSASRSIAFETVAEEVVAPHHQAGVTFGWSMIPQQRFDLVWLCESRALLQDVMEFLNRRYGRLVPFYTSTWHQDFDVIGTSTNHVDTPNVGFSLARETLFTAGGWPLEMVMTRGASRLITEIVGCVDNGATERIQLGDWPLAYPVEEIMFSRLLYARLAEDSVSVDYHSAGIAVVSASAITIPTEQP